MCALPSRCSSAHGRCVRRRRFPRQPPPEACRRHASGGGWHGNHHHRDSNDRWHALEHRDSKRRHTRSVARTTTPQRPPITSADVSLTKTARPTRSTSATRSPTRSQSATPAPPRRLGVRVTDTLDATTTFVSASLEPGKLCPRAPNSSVSSARYPQERDDHRRTRDTASRRHAHQHRERHQPNARSNQANNDAKVTTEVTSADLSLTKTDAPDPVNVGDALAYTLTIRNTGPSTAAGVRFEDPVDATTAFVSASGDPGYLLRSARARLRARRAAGRSEATSSCASRRARPGPLTNTASVTSQTL